MSLTWRGTDSSSGNERPFESTRSHAERTLTGGLTRAVASRGRLALVAGTTAETPPATPHAGDVMDRNSKDFPNFADELPVIATLDVDAGHLALAMAAPVTNSTYQASRYVEAIATALPASLPAMPVGAGASWQTVVIRGPETATTTWVVVSRTGSVVVLASKLSIVTATDRVLGPMETWSQSASGEVTTQIDLATFAVTATIERGQSTKGSDSMHSWSSSRTESATLSITPR